MDDRVTDFMTSAPFSLSECFGGRAGRFHPVHRLQPGKGTGSVPQRRRQISGPPSSLRPVCWAALTSSFLFLACLPGPAPGSPSGQHSAPFTRGTEQTGLLWPGVQPDTHPTAWPWTQARLCLQVKEHLSPFLPGPGIQHAACQGGLRGSLTPAFVQRCKLSTYCVPGRRQPHPHPRRRPGRGSGTAARDTSC